MKTSIESLDFSHTTIKKPFEKMRANAIINAENNAAGLSMINFNLTAFLSSSRHEDAYFILSHWAIAPIHRQPQKFAQQPESGHSALIKRAELLISHLQRRPDIPDGFIEAAKGRMIDFIDKSIPMSASSTSKTQSA